MSDIEDDFNRMAVARFETRYHLDDRALIDSKLAFADVDVGQTESPGWRNPPHGIRVFLVTLVCAFPGVLAGQLTKIVTNLTCDSSVAAVGGAVILAFVGGVIELRGE